MGMFNQQRWGLRTTKAMDFHDKIQGAPLKHQWIDSPQWTANLINAYLPTFTLQNDPKIVEIYMIQMDRHGAIWGCNMTPEGIQRTRQSCWPMTVARPHTVETCCNDMGPNSTKNTHICHSTPKNKSQTNAKVSDVRNFFRPWHMWHRDTIQLFLWMVDRNGIF